MDIPDVPTSSVPATPSAALQALLAGNARFAAQTAHKPNQSLSHLALLRTQQTPFATLISCSDSRVPPEIIFDQGIGDLFIVRVAGNIVTPAELGSCEYGASVLKTKVLLVLGHSGCGAVKAALGHEQVFGHISTLLEAIQPSVNQTNCQPGDPVKNAVKANVLAQIEQLLESAVIANLLNEKEIQVVGAYFDIGSGKAELLSIRTHSDSTIQPNAPQSF